jgi:hypothetical protein
MYPGKDGTRSLILSALALTLAGVTAILFGNYGSWGFPLLGAAFGYFVACCVRWWKSRSRTSRE